MSAWLATQSSFSRPGLGRSHTSGRGAFIKEHPFKGRQDRSGLADAELGQPATRRSVATQGGHLWRQRRDGSDRAIYRRRRRDTLARSRGPNDACGLAASRWRYSICRRRRQFAHPTRRDSCHDLGICRGRAAGPVPVRVCPGAGSGNASHRRDERNRERFASPAHPQHDAASVANHSDAFRGS